MRKKIVFIILTLIVLSMGLIIGYKLLNKVEKTHIHHYGNNKDFFIDSTKTFDNHFIIIGGGSDKTLTENDNVENELDGFVSKVNQNMEVIWSIDTDYEKNDYYTAVIETSEHDILTVGYKNTSGNDAGLYNDGQAFITLFDDDGNERWTKILLNGKSDHLYDVIETKDGHFVACGSTYVDNQRQWDTFFIKFNKLGEILWEKAYGSHGFDIIYSMVETKNGDLLAVGTANNDLEFDDDFNEDSILIKLGQDGNKLSHKRFEHYDTLFDITKTYDHHFELTGRRDTIGSCIIKIDENGNIIWDESNINLYARFITEDKEHNIILVGSINRTNSNSGAGVISKYDKDGKEVFTTVIEYKPDDSIDRYLRYFSLLEMDEFYYIFGTNIRNGAIITKVTKDGELINE